jgi:hypothetical protein
LNVLMAIVALVLTIACAVARGLAAGLAEPPE